MLHEFLQVVVVATTLMGMMVLTRMQIPGLYRQDSIQRAAEMDDFYPIRSFEEHKHTGPPPPLREEHYGFRQHPRFHGEYLNILQ